MTFRRGPLRIVLLRSGGFDYAELELHEPVHLVADNNVGKTSLIAALQFLYIDEFDKMGFATDWRESKLHYFPTADSAILFECWTPSGHQVLCLRGLGVTRGHVVERFVYAGEYRREHFVDGNRLRPFTEVIPLIVGKGLTYLEPKHHRASLLGAGDTNKSLALGVVPLAKPSVMYDSFRYLFKNLLKLSRIEQGQLKRLFVDIKSNAIRVPRINLREEFAETFADVERNAVAIAELKAVSNTIEELISEFKQRDQLRERIAARWTVIEYGVRRFREARDNKRNDAKIEAETLKTRAGLTTDELKECNKKALETGGELSEVQRDLKDLSDLGSRVRDYAEALEDTARTNLQKKRAKLTARLEAATTAKATSVKMELEILQASLEKDEQLLRRTSETTAAWMRAHSGLSDEQIDNVFGILNPALLGEFVGASGVVVKSSTRLQEQLNGIAASFSEQGYLGEGVSVPRSSLPRTRPLAEFHDVVLIRERIENAQERSEKMVQLLRDIEKRDGLAAELSAAEADLKRAESRLEDWKKWHTQRRNQKPWEDKRDELMKRAHHHAKEQERLQQESTQLALRGKELEGEIAAADNAYKVAQRIANRLEAPQPGWRPGKPAPEDWDIPLDGLAGQYEVLSREHRQADGRVEGLFARVEKATSGRYTNPGETELISKLKDELAALASREALLGKSWISLVGQMRGVFKALKEGVDEVRTEVQRLSNALGKRKISNLRLVELELIPQRDLLKRMDALLEMDAGPLFQGTEGRSKAALDIASWIQDRPEISLVDLFDLRFHVTDRHGQVKTSSSLAEMESQGTGVTIKVLVHLELLRGMLRDEEVSIPFFLDEITSLDIPNMRRLIQDAVEMGFIPVVASPDAREVIETLYFLRPGEKGLVLNKNSSVNWRKRPPHAS